ncbi:hypothetical protein [Mucilaginibacter antarcticus]|uniref:hypothetical protein n=1 Tax=Mucilaginibacter antarcticus TaxID=1855725 RepID=UPI00363A7112
MADTVAIGNHLIGLYKNWSPEDFNQPDLHLGELYGFDLFIRQKLQTVEDGFSSRITYVTSLYAESRSTGIKYMQNGGAPNIDNPKHAARYFLDAINRVVGMAERYEKELDGINRQIPEVRELSQRPFDQEYELASLKKIWRNWKWRSAKRSLKGKNRHSRSRNFRYMQKWKKSNCKLLNCQ